MPEPAVSVIIPTYNRLEYLKKALITVQAQSLGNWELTIVDDGSSDGTAEYVESLGDSRVRVERREHSGNPARIRNVGVRRSRGRYVAFLDSDDLWEPSKLERQVAAMAESGCRWSYTRFDMIDDAGRGVPFTAGGDWYPYSGDIVAPLLATKAAVAISSLVVERALAMGVGGFDESDRLLFREDYEFCLRLALQAPVTVVPELLCHVRQHGGRATMARRDLYGRSADVYRKIEVLLTDAGLRRLCRHRCALHLVADADAHRGAGDRVSAWRCLVDAFRYDPWSPRWWVVMVKLALRV
ncbi:MAG: glycosyltransferase family 2 protein [Gemmatimonadetes bacterium]|nr:glycosyltransferase family 2 protein [Gemmatimonadota bacterium]